MRDLILATHNRHKVDEMRQALQGLPFRVLSADDLPGGLPEVEEDGITLLFNAQKKARSAAQASGLLALADDTGLEVEALDGAPGVYSARYAGPGCSYEDNNRKLLAEISQVPRAGRKAVFRTVLALSEPAAPSGKVREDWVEGRCDGVISERPSGTQGFGYDPLFFVPGLGKTFAELTLQEKNKVSHRGRALEKIRIVLSRW
jgi:XTP/dITP diphosphohydrolase